MIMIKTTDLHERNGGGGRAPVGWGITPAGGGSAPVGGGRAPLGGGSAPAGIETGTGPDCCTVAVVSIGAPL